MARYVYIGNLFGQKTQRFSSWICFRVKPIMLDRRSGDWVSSIY